MKLTAEFETANLLRVVDEAPDAILQRVKTDAAKPTSDRIVAEAKGRVARRTGRTAAGIHAEEAHDGNGYVVVATNEHAPLAPVMLEFGTRYMSRREFFFASARIEEGAHERRVFEAVQTEINEKGLGD